MTPLEPALTASKVSRFVEDVRVIAPAVGGPRRVDRLPDGRTALIFRRFAGRGQGDVFVAGPRTRAVLKEATGFTQAVLVQLKPGWSNALLGVPTHELTDSWVPLHDLWRGPGEASPTRLLELAGERSVGELLDGVAHALVVRANQAPEPASARLARRAVRLMEANTGVERMASQLGVTARHLRRAFLENIGIGPKDYGRSLRLQRAVRMALLSVTPWARIAAEAGYYDQSHLIADFRQLIGLTPSAFLERARSTPPLPPRAPK